MSGRVSGSRLVSAAMALLLLTGLLLATEWLTSSAGALARAVFDTVPVATEGPPDAHPTTQPDASTSAGDANPFCSWIEHNLAIRCHASWSANATRSLVQLGVAIAILWGLLLLIYMLRGRFIRLRARMVFQEKAARPALIIGLSSVNQSEDAEDTTLLLGRIPLHVLALPETEYQAHVTHLQTGEKAGSLTADEQQQLDNIRAASQSIGAQDQLRLAHPWRHICRAVYGHLGKLQAVYVVTSSGDRGSHKDFDSFSRLLKSTLGATADEIDIRSARTDGVDYYNLDEITDCLHDTIDKLTKSPYGFSPKQICIDATAGTKPFSVAAATTTMRKDLVFSYVDNEGRLKFYDGQIEVPYILGEPA